MEKKDEELRQEMLELQMIEERLQSLIERYTLEIEDETKNLKKYKGALENVLKESDCLSEVDNSRICSLHRIVERKANRIVLMKEFLSDLEYMKGENIASIEVAYPATWTVEYLTKAKSGTNTNSDERKD